MQSCIKKNNDRTYAYIHVDVHAYVSSPPMPTQMHAEKHVRKRRSAIIWEKEKGDCGPGGGSQNQGEEEALKSNLGWDRAVCTLM